MTGGATALNSGFGDAELSARCSQMVYYTFAGTRAGCRNGMFHAYVLAPMCNGHQGDGTACVRMVRIAQGAPCPSHSDALTAGLAGCSGAEQIFWPKLTCAGGARKVFWLAEGPEKNVPNHLRGGGGPGGGVRPPPREMLSCEAKLWGGGMEGVRPSAEERPVTALLLLSLRSGCACPRRRGVYLRAYTRFVNFGCGQCGQ